MRIIFASQISEIDWIRLYLLQFTGSVETEINKFYSRVFSVWPKIEKAKKIQQDIPTFFCAALQTIFIADHLETSKTTMYEIKRAMEVREDPEDKPRSGQLKSMTD